MSVNDSEHGSAPGQPPFPGPDTIVALATAVGGPIAVLRVSGPGAVRVVEAVWSGRLPLSRPPFRQMRLGVVTGPDRERVDRALAVYFPSPASYTGEDVAEIQCHGGVLPARLVLLGLLRAGARMAEPGEFTKRAFLNGKMDLTQAEAVADLISAHSEMALHLALSQLSGELRTRLDRVYERLTSVRSDLEACLDFGDSDAAFPDPGGLDRVLVDLHGQLDVLWASQREGAVLRQGVRLVLAGPANVGKSSLLNRILGRDRAIVTHLPGTTRDTLEEPAHIRGIPVSLVDTAGIRDTVDLVERTGVQRTYASIREAQVLLWIVDAADSDTWQRPPRDAGLGPVITVINKRDLTGSEAQERCLRALGTESVPVSALTGEGIDALFDAVEQAVWRSPHTEAPAVAVNARHAGLLREALDALHATRACMARGEWETAAVCIRDVQDAVGRVLGRTVAPDVLDRIFGRFCIGK